MSRGFDCDLHFHGFNSGGVSKNMLPSVIGEQTELKGLDIVGSADILNKEWYDLVKKETIEEDGCFKFRDSKTKIILTTEVQIGAVHYLVFLRDFSSVSKIRGILKETRLDGKGFGRPWLKMGLEEFYSKIEGEGIIGPAHIFTPYFGLLGKYNDLEIFGEMKDKVYFCELGLSADSEMANNKILENLSFLSFSDSHSPWVHKIGREFTRIKMGKGNYEGLEKALKKKEIEFNVGLNPKEGMYHCTACNKCYKKYSLEEGERYKWKCFECGGIIKKGVYERSLEFEKSEKKRPEYKYVLPLAEIISLAYGEMGINCVKVQSKWMDFISVYKNEKKVLLEIDLGELGEIDKKIAEYIGAFRENRVLYIPGGGGNYGKPKIFLGREEFEREKGKEEYYCCSRKCKTIFDY